MTAWEPTPERVTLLLQSFGLLRPGLLQGKEDSTNGSSYIEISVVQELPQKPYILRRRSQGNIEATDPRGANRTECRSPFDTERDLLSRLYVLTTVEMDRKFLLKVFTNRDPFMHPATALDTEGCDDDKALLMDLVQIAIENELGAIEWAEKKHLGIKLPHILGYAYHRCASDLGPCLDAFGLMGLLLMEFPRGGVAYQGLAQECRLDDAQRSELSDNLAKGKARQTIAGNCPVDLLRDLRAIQANSESVVSVQLQISCGQSPFRYLCPESDTPDSSATDLTMEQGAAVGHSHGCPSTSRTSISSFGSWTTTRGSASPKGSHENLLHQQALRPSFVVPSRATTPTKGSVSISKSALMPYITDRSEEDKHGCVEYGDGHKGSQVLKDGQPTYRQNSPAYNTGAKPERPSHPLPPQHPSTLPIDLTPTTNLRLQNTATFASNRQTCHLSSTPSSATVRHSNSRGAASRVPKPSSTSIYKRGPTQTAQTATATVIDNRLPRPSLSPKSVVTNASSLRGKITYHKNKDCGDEVIRNTATKLLSGSPSPKNPLEACQKLVQYDETSKSRIQTISSGAGLTVDIQAASAIKSRCASIDDTDTDIRPWFDDDPTMYCSCRAQMAIQQGGSIGHLTYSPAALSVQGPSLSSIASGPSKRLISKLSTKDNSTNRAPFVWRTENTLLWPKTFVYPNAKNGIFRTVAEFEQARLVNALVALERLDSFVGSTCRFPAALLELLPRVLSIAFDEFVFAESNLDLPLRRKVATSLEKNPLFRPEGVFKGVHSVFTHGDLEPSSLFIHGQRGEILAVTNFQRAGFLPTYVEDIHGPFIERSLASFWKTTEAVDGKECEQPKSHSRAARLLPFLGFKSMTFDQHGENDKITSLRLNDRYHPGPYPIVNHYFSKGSETIACKTMVYAEPTSIHTSPAQKTCVSNSTVGANATATLRRIIATTTNKDTQGDSSMAPNMNQRTQTHLDRVELKTPQRQSQRRSQSGRPPLSPLPVSNPQFNQSSVSFASTSHNSNISSSYSTEPNVVTISPNGPTYYHDPSTQSLPFAQSGLSCSYTATLIPKVVKVNQDAWSKFQTTYRLLEQPPTTERAGVSGMTGSVIKKHNRTMATATVALLDEFEQGSQVPKTLEALVSISKTLQNLVVILESGGVVATPEQLTAAIAIKRESRLQQEEERMAEIEIENLCRRERHQQAVEQQLQAQQQLVSQMQSSKNSKSARNSAQVPLVSRSLPSTPSNTRSTGISKFKSFFNKKTAPSSSSSSRALKSAASYIPAYKRSHSLEDDILYSAPGLQRDPLPSELPDHILVNACGNTPLSDKSFSTFRKAAKGNEAGGTTSGSEGGSFIDVSRAAEPKLGSMIAPDLPVYGIRLTNRDGTKTLAQVEGERVEKEEQEFWREFEGHCDLLEGSSSQKQRDGCPGIALFSIQDFEQNLEIVERYVAKVEAEAAKYYRQVLMTKDG
ncbi:hypothetical protein BGZ51_004329 [Haplosporangium sp. Z 767]|nr:hypothetical protein BGZ51_004329 [Haplosporangium sp. Z 767]